MMRRQAMIRAAALAGALLLAAAPVVAQDRPPDPNAQNPAWHAQQQLAWEGEVAHAVVPAVQSTLP